MEAAAIPMWQPIRATVHDFTRNDECATSISHRCRQDHDSKPVKFVLISVRNEVTAIEVSRLDRDALQTPFGALANHIVAAPLTRNDKGWNSMQGKFSGDQHLTCVAHLLFGETLEPAS
jgi:hypothetical protein